MISLFLTILCSTSIALILKLNDSRSGQPLVLLAANYLVASLISLVFFAFSDAGFVIEVIVFGALLAGSFVFSFFVFTRAVSIAGTALSTVSSRLSVIVPLLLSVVLYKEWPTDWQTAGFVFTFITIALFYFSLKNHGTRKIGRRDLMYLCAVLLGIGVSDFCMKVFQNWRPPADKALFLTAIFTFAFIYCFSIILIRKIKITQADTLRGLVLGIPNVFSSYFLLGALSALPAIVVYPVTNIGIILLTSIGAWLIWKEKLNTFGKLALLSGMISIMLMSL